MAKQSLGSEAMSFEISVSRLMEIFSKTKKIVLKAETEDDRLEDKYVEAARALKACLRNSKMPLEILKENLNTFNADISKAITDNEEFFKYVTSSLKENKDDLGFMGIIGKYMEVGDRASILEIFTIISEFTTIDFSHFTFYLNILVRNEYFQSDFNGAYNPLILEKIAAVIDSTLKTRKQLGQLIQTLAFMGDISDEKFNKPFITDFYLLISNRIQVKSKELLLLIPSASTQSLLK